MKNKILKKLYLCFFLQLESLGQSELASRLTLNCQNSYVEPHKIRDIPVTIMDVSFLSVKPMLYLFYMYMSRSTLQIIVRFFSVASNTALNLFLPPAPYTASSISKKNLLLLILYFSWKE